MSTYRINKNQPNEQVFSDLETAVSTLLETIGNDPNGRYLFTEDSYMTAYFDVILAEYDPVNPGCSSFIGSGGFLEIMDPYAVLIKLAVSIIKIESILTVNDNYCISFHLPPVIKNALGVEGFYYLLETFAFLALGVLWPSYSSDGVHYDNHFSLGDNVPQWVINLAAA